MAQRPSDPGHALIIGATLQTVGALIRCVKPAAPGSAYLASRQNILPNSPWFWNKNVEYVDNNAASWESWVVS